MNIGSFGDNYILQSLRPHPNKYTNFDGLGHHWAYRRPNISESHIGLYSGKKRFRLFSPCWISMKCVRFKLWYPFLRINLFFIFMKFDGPRSLIRYSSFIWKHYVCFFFHILPQIFKPCWEEIFVMPNVFLNNRSFRQNIHCIGWLLK